VKLLVRLLFELCPGQNSMKFHVDALHSFKVILRTKFEYKNQRRAITPKVWCLELWFLCTALALNDRDLSVYESSSQQLDYFLSYAPDKIQEWKWTKGNNSKSMKLWVMVLCTALLLNEIWRTDGQTYGRTDWLTDWLTDESITICHPSAENSRFGNAWVPPLVSR